VPEASGLSDGNGLGQEQQVAGDIDRAITGELPSKYSQESRTRILVERKSAKRAKEWFVVR
jgi:hypothetical protein